MKRFHVHVGVQNLAKSIGFYSTLFGRAPHIEKPDYAKWMLDDPRLNFAISLQGSQSGLNHLGFQVEDAAELHELHSRLTRAAAEVVSEENKDCCYARSDKHWVQDPSGIAWESFHTLSEAPEIASQASTAKKRSCCAPTCCA